MFRDFSYLSFRRFCLLLSCLLLAFQFLSFWIKFRRATVHVCEYAPVNCAREYPRDRAGRPLCGRCERVPDYPFDVRKR